MNPAITSQAGSTIRALNAAKRPTSIDLGMGEPTLPPEIRHFEEATRWVARHGCKYSTNIGDPDLRAAIAAHYGYPSLDDAANVCVTTGSAEAVYVAMKTLVDPARDEILLVEPAFPVYAKIALVEGIPLRTVGLDPADGFKFDAERIVAALRPETRLLILCSPCNPTGRTLTTAAVETIASALEARPGPPVYVLHDAIYRELEFASDVGEFGRRYRHTIAIDSLSKSNALTGLRIGWLVADAEAMPHLVKMHGWATSCANTFSQRVALEVFRAHELGAHRPWYAARREVALAAARDAGLDVVAPDGAFYLFVRTGAEDGVAFSYGLLEDEDVVAVPGGVFGASGRGWLRTTFLAEPEVLRDGYARIARYVARTRTAVVAGGAEA